MASDVGAAVEGGERRQLPLHFHTFPAVPPDTIQKHPGRVGRSVFFTVVSGFQMNLVNILAAIIGANVLERYPHVRIAFGESGFGWIPYALDRMDFEWEDRFTDLGLKMKPSDYWRRQCKATFQFDRIGAKLIDDMGAESLMWGSDYPHGDGVWPHSDKYIKEQFADVLGGAGQDDHLHQCRQVLRPDQLTSALFDTTCRRAKTLREARRSGVRVNDRRRPCPRAVDVGEHQGRLATIELASLILSEPRRAAEPVSLSIVSSASMWLTKFS